MTRPSFFITVSILNWCTYNIALRIYTVKKKWQKSSFSATADIYAHLADKGKVQSADAMKSTLHKEKSPSVQRTDDDF